MLGVIKGSDAKYNLGILDSHSSIGKLDKNFEKLLEKLKNTLNSKNSFTSLNLKLKVLNEA